MNQVEASFLDWLKIYGDVEKTNVLIKEFITGYNETLTESHHDLRDDVLDFVYFGYSFQDYSRQKCKNMFVSMDFRGKTLTWKELPSNWYQEGELGNF